MLDGNKIIVIGGSAGSITVLTSILDSIQLTFLPAIILVLHRQRNVESDMKKIFGHYTKGKQIAEPDDKQPVLAGHIYLAPQNYHLLIESDETFSLDYSEPVQYSRPSIDVTFESAAMVFNSRLTGILLSGANSDGSVGLQSILQHGGKAIVQNPATAEYVTMPQSALDLNPGCLSLSPDEIMDYLKYMTNINQV